MLKWFHLFDEMVSGTSKEAGRELLEYKAWGRSVDRLVLFLTNRNNIKEALFIPAMKPDQFRRQPTERGWAEAES